MSNLKRRLRKAEQLLKKQEQAQLFKVELDDDFYHLVSHKESKPYVPIYIDLAAHRDEIMVLEEQYIASPEAARDYAAALFFAAGWWEKQRVKTDD